MRLVKGAKEDRLNWPELVPRLFGGRPCSTAVIITALALAIQFLTSFIADCKCTNA